MYFILRIIFTQLVLKADLTNSTLNGWKQSVYPSLRGSKEVRRA